MYVLFAPVEKINVILLHSAVPMDNVGGISGMAQLTNCSILIIRNKASICWLNDSVLMAELASL